MKYTIVCVAIGLALGASVAANGFGMTVDKPAGDYIANIDYDATNGIFTGVPVYFVYQLYTKDRSQMIAFDNAWVTVTAQGGQSPLFASQLAFPDIGPAGMVFTFPKAGSYDMHVDYVKADKTLAEASFPFTVADQGGVLTNKNFQIGDYALGALTMLIIAALVWFFKRKKNT